MSLMVKNYHSADDRFLQMIDFSFYSEKNVAISFDRQKTGLKKRLELKLNIAQTS